MLFCFANSATGDCCNCIPRPLGLSGAVIISAGIKSSCFKISRVLLATSGVPKNAKFNFWSILFSRQFFFNLLGVVDKEDAVQVFGFVLEDLCQETGSAASEFFAFLVVGRNRRFFRSEGFAVKPAHRETALRHPGLFAREFGNLRIDENQILYGRISSCGVAVSACSRSVPSRPVGLQETPCGKSCP